MDEVVKLLEQESGLEADTAKRVVTTVAEFIKKKPSAPLAGRSTDFSPGLKPGIWQQALAAAWEASGRSRRCAECSSEALLQPCPMARGTWSWRTGEASGTTPFLLLSKEGCRWA